MLVVLFFSYLWDDPALSRYKQGFAAQVNLDGLFPVELTEDTSFWECSGVPCSGGSAAGSGSVVWNN